MELQESEERFRATFEQAAVGVAHVSLEGRFLRVNQKFSDIVGYTHQEMLEVTFQDITHSDDLALDLDNVNQLLAGELPTYSMEKRYFHKNGSIVWINLTVSLLRKSTGEPDYFIAVIEEISDKKAAEQRIQESEENLLLAQKIAHVGNWSWNIKEDIITWSEEVYRIYGLEIGSKINLQTLTSLIHPEDIEAHNASIEAWITKGENIPFEYRVIRPDGELRYIYGAGLTQYNQGGEAIFLLGTLQDKTSDKNAQILLEQSEERFRTLIEQSPLSIQICDKEGRVVDVNKAWMKLWNIYEEDLPAIRENYNLLHDEEVAKRGILPLIKRAFKGETIALPEIEYESGGVIDVMGLAKEKGKSVWLKVRFYPLKDVEGNIQNIISIEEDITERKQADLALQQSRDYLQFLADSMADAVFSIKLPERNIEWFNDSYQVLGYTREERLGQPTKAIFSDPDDYPKFGALMNAAIKSGQPILAYEVKLRRGNGDIIPAEIRTTFYREHGKVVSATSVVRDITDRYEAEKERINYQRRLKHLSTELESTQHRERRKLATELHDHVGQSLAVMRIQLAVAIKEANGRKLESVLHEVSNSLRQAVEDTRNIITEISSPVLNELGLSAAIADFMNDKISKKYGLQVQFNEDSALPQLNDEIKTILYRNVRELLMNVVKHANASAVSVSIHCKQNRLQIIVQDDGVGLVNGTIPNQKINDSGLGLFSIKENMADIGGNLSVEQHAGNGIRAILNTPL
jgi:PAS domain S-box-containing protein